MVGDETDSECYCVSEDRTVCANNSLCILEGISKQMGALPHEPHKIYYDHILIDAMYTNKS